jgi:hypothetical protein
MNRGLSDAADTANRIRSLLDCNHLVLRDLNVLENGMLSGVQPLCIGPAEICTDTVLVELITYPTSELMHRETSTMTVRKAAYGIFEGSLTPIPKYLFTDTSFSEVALVHSVPRVTLGDLLVAVEKAFPSVYIGHPLLFTGHHIAAFFDRIRFSASSALRKWGKRPWQPPRPATAAPRRILPAVRNAFAHHIVAAVARHHAQGIYHDRISARTIFFPLTLQPQFLADYAGIPSAMLGEYIPPDLLAGEIAARYGPQGRDVYCIALLCYRIITGKQIDGRLFSIGSPRPAAMVFREIGEGCGLSMPVRKFSDGAKRCIARMVTIKRFISLLPRIVDSNRYTEWRALNRATGGAWRIVPVIGSIGDILFPTRSARALRRILDRHWAGVTDKIPRLPDMSTLAGAFRTKRTGVFPEYEMVGASLNGESVLRRAAFGSMMESGLSIRRAFRLIFPSRQLLYVIVVMLLLAAPLTKLLQDRVMRSGEDGGDTAIPVDTVIGRPVASPVSAPAPVPERSQAGDTVIPPFDSAADISAAVSPPVDTASRSSDQYIQPQTGDAEKKSLHRPASQGASSHKADPKPDSRAKKKKQAARDNIAIRQPLPAPAPPVVDTTPPPPPPPPKGLLVPAKGNPEVFVVTGIPDSCNPGSLYYTYEGMETTVKIAQLPTPYRRLYLARRHGSGMFDSIQVIRLCRTGGCDPLMYYEPRGVEGVGKPVFVGKGDALSPNRVKLWVYIRDRRNAGP